MSVSSRRAQYPEGCCRDWRTSFQISVHEDDLGRRFLAPFDRSRGFAFRRLLDVCTNAVAGSLRFFRLHHTICVEAADLTFAVANLAQHNRCVLSQEWRRQAV